MSSSIVGDWHNFVNFLTNEKNINLIITLIITAQISLISKSISDGLIVPILTPILKLFKVDGLKNLKVTVIGMTFLVGDIIANIINFIFVAFLIYLFVKFVFRKSQYFTFN